MKLTVGYSPFVCPQDGMGNFASIFNKGVNLLQSNSLKGIDALLLWGGADISPTLYAEKRLPGCGPAEPSSRDMFEFELCREALKKGIPIIGVCRGAQFICAFAGGKLVQDVSGHTEHHDITVHSGQTFQVTSSHHQMLYPFEVSHKLLGWSTQHESHYYLGCEAAKSIESKEHNEPEVVYFPDVNGFAIQCHPEWHPENHPFNKWVHEEIEQACFGVEIEA